MSFRAARNFGFGLIVFMLFVVSIMSYYSVSRSSRVIEHVISEEKVMLRKWHGLSRMIHEAKDNLANYYLGTTDDITTVSISIDRAMKEVEALAKMPGAHESGVNYASIVSELREFKQVIHVYGSEFKNGFPGGTSVKEMEKKTLQAARNIAELINGIYMGISSRIDEHNMTILDTTKNVKRMIVPLLLVFISVIVTAALFISRALAKPVRELVNVTKLVAEGDLSPEISGEFDDEIGELSTSIGRMIRDLRSQRTQLVDKDYVDSILHSMNDSLIVISPDGIIKTVNRAALELLGYEEQELCETPIDKVFAGGSTAMECFRKKGFGTTEASCITKTGSTISVMYSCSVMKDDNDGVKGTVHVMRDITERKNVEEELKKHRVHLEELVDQRTYELQSTNDILQGEIAIRNKAKDELMAYADKLERSNNELTDFANTASHDLQEPLRKVMAFGDRLKSKYSEELGEQGRDYLERMQSAAGRMQNLINGLLTFSRVTTKAQPFIPVELSTIAQEVVSDLEIRIEQTGGRVEVGALPVIEADQLQMRQLIQNLIGNALKFHKKDEPPVVKVKGSLVRRNGCDPKKTRSDKELYELIFEDNGIGFEDKYTERIFGIFQRLENRSEFEGSGIGLSVCRKIVERHGGNISAKSSLGAGTTFTVTLPLKQTTTGGIA